MMSFQRFFKSRRVWLWGFILVFAAIAAFSLALFFSLPDVSDLKVRNPETTALIKFRLKKARENGTELTVNHTWISFENIPQLLKDTVRIAEDASFYQHKGIDYYELKESIKKNLREKNFSRGGSTITQQLAKNLYLSTGKNIIRKIKEFFIAGRLEKNLTKSRIFEIYLNVIEFGPGIFGVQAAARYFFGHSVSELDLEEIVRLTAVIPQPLSTDPRKNNSWLRWRCRWLLHKLQLYKYISEEDFQGAIKLFEE